MRCWLKGGSSTVVSHNRNTTAALARVQLVESREEVATMENTTKSVAYAAAGSSVIGATSTYLRSAVAVLAPISPRFRGELCPLSGEGLAGQYLGGTVLGGTVLGGTVLGSGSPAGSTWSTGMTAGMRLVARDEHPQATSAATAAVIAAAVVTGDADHRSTDRKFVFVKYRPGSRSLRPPA
jgi:hypothetical protein